MLDNTTYQLTTISIDDFVDVVIKDPNLILTLGNIIETNPPLDNKVFSSNEDYVEIGMMDITDKPILVTLLIKLFEQSKISIDEKEYLEMINVSKGWNQMCESFGKNLTMRMCDNFFDTYEPILNSKMKTIIDIGLTT
jgi:hypothetical protein